MIIFSMNMTYKQFGKVKKMKKTKKVFAMLLAAAMLLTLSACGGQTAPETTAPAATAPQVTAAPTDVPTEAPAVRTIVDGNGREVEIPYTVESIVCVGVGALRYTCYVGGQDLGE